MESSNFNLTNEIDNYVSLIEEQGSLTESDRNELISHLNDSTEVLMEKGLTDEESFIIAKKRIGNPDLLTEEYSKINFSLKTSKVWAYLLVGFNIIYGIPSLLILLLAALYYIVFREFSTSSTAIIIVTTVNVLIIIGIWTLAKYRMHISSYIETQVAQKPSRFIILTSIPVLIKMLYLPAFSKLMPGMSINYAIYNFNSGLTEFSLYLLIISVVGVFLTLVFSINNNSEHTLKTLFAQPSMWFLISFGMLIEILAASTRALRLDNIVVESLLFAGVYACASFLIAFYNKSTSINKYIIAATLLGLILEVSVGISADLGRGNTYYTAYFTVALIGGVAFGRYIGLKTSLSQELSKV